MSGSSCLEGQKIAKQYQILETEKFQILLNV
jgi:hypothetical protein